MALVELDNMKSEILTYEKPLAEVKASLDLDSKEKRIDMSEAVDVLKYFELARNYWIAKGKAEGKSEGRVEERLDSVTNMLAEGLTVEQISRYLHLSLDEVTSLAAKAKPLQ